MSTTQSSSPAPGWHTCSLPLCTEMDHTAAFTASSTCLALWWHMPTSSVSCPPMQTRWSWKPRWRHILTQGHTSDVNNMEAAQVLIYSATIQLKRRWLGIAPPGQELIKRRLYCAAPSSTENNSLHKSSDCSGKLGLVFSLQIHALSFVYATARLTGL